MPASHFPSIGGLISTCPPAIPQLEKIGVFLRCEQVYETVSGVNKSSQLRILGETMGPYFHHVLYRLLSISGSRGLSWEGRLCPCSYFPPASMAFLDRLGRVSGASEPGCEQNVHTVAHSVPVAKPAIEAR